LSRSDLPPNERRPFNLYLDEFQNFVDAGAPEVLAEARKYRLNLVLANQTLSQLMREGKRDLLDAVLGNVATKIFMRVGLAEAQQVAAEFAPYFDAETLTQLPDRHALCRVQMHNRPSLPFVLQTLPPRALPEGASIERSEQWARSPNNA